MKDYMFLSILLCSIFNNWKLGREPALMNNISFALETPSSGKPWPVNTNTETASTPLEALVPCAKALQGFAMWQILAPAFLSLGLFYKCMLVRWGAHTQRARNCVEKERVWFWSQFSPSALWKQSAHLGFCVCQTIAKPQAEHFLNLNPHKGGHWVREICLLQRHEVEALLHEGFPGFSMDAVIGMAYARVQCRGTNTSCSWSGRLCEPNCISSVWAGWGEIGIRDSIILITETLTNILRLVFCQQR